MLPEDDHLARKVILLREFYLMENGLLFHMQATKGGRKDNYYKQLVVPPDYQKEIMEAYHDDIFGGHLGLAKTLSKVRQKYYWQSMANDIKQWCDSCQNCS